LMGHRGHIWILPAPAGWKSLNLIVGKAQAAWRCAHWSGWLKAGVHSDMNLIGLPIYRNRDYLKK
jgi:hypothetical protein